MILIGLVILGQALAASPGVAEADGVTRKIFDTADEALRALESPEDEMFLLYLHGAIIELGDRRPTHPERGTYEYDLILQALADDGLVVISEQRPRGTIPADYAEQAANEVRKLLEAGADPDRVTVAGFSKGGHIALRTSGSLAREDVRFVILAICGPWFDDIELPLHGHVLSIHEATDDGIVSCRSVVERSPSMPASFEEIETNMGGGHGAFFKPQDAWLRPLVNWAQAGSEISAD